MTEEIKEIRQKFLNGTSLSELETTYSKLKEEKPYLFGMICSNNCDDKLLDTLLKTYEKVKIGEQSQYDASVDVGTILVDKFVKPELPDLDA